MVFDKKCIPSRNQGRNVVVRRNQETGRKKSEVDHTEWNCRTRLYNGCSTGCSSVPMDTKIKILSTS